MRWGTPTPNSRSWSSSAQISSGRPPRLSERRGRMAGASAASEAGSAMISRIRERRREAGIFLDFDGTLSEIVALPELETVVPAAASELSRLTGEYGLVAVVSGRPAAQVRTLVGVPGVEAFG